MPSVGENDMVNGRELQPVTARGARDHGPRRGRRAGTGPGLPGSAGRGSSRGYVAASRALLALVGPWSWGGAGCTGRGAGYARMGETPGAVGAVRQSSGEISRLARNARYYRLMGQPELGLKELEQAHQQNPGDLQIVNLLAQNYEELGKFEAARQLYEEALTRQGSNPVIANNLCFSYYQEGRWQEAESCFRHALARDPQNQAVRNNLGLLYCRLGRQDEARRLWQEAEGVTAADAKMSQVQAALGTAVGPVYARKPEPAPATAPAKPAPAMQAAVPQLTAPVPVPVQAKANIPAPPVAPKEAAKPLAAKLTMPAAGPKAEAMAPPVAPKEAVKPPAPVPGPVAARPQQGPREPAVGPVPARPVATPGPAPQAAPPLTAADLVGTAIEIRNGTWTKDLARETRSLLQLEGFTVAEIGNHVDFGATKTVIYYRPEAETVARALAAKIFPGAELALSTKLNKGMDIKVLLGRDVAENAQFLARLHEDRPLAALGAATPPAPDKLMTAGPQVARPATSPPEPPKVVPAKAGPQQPTPPQAKEVAAPPLPSPEPRSLTAAELLGTAIEIRNGTWTKDLARETRSLLQLEGFTVAEIGNHVDFGATKTVIYYRPEAETVARALAAKIFRGAELAPGLKLKKGMDIKILLGADLLQRPRLMARLVAEGK